MNKIGLLKEIWDFMKVRKKWWLLPIIILFLLFGSLLILAAQSPAVAPFIYALF